MTTPNQLLTVARGYIGVREATGNNDGTAVHHLQATTGAYDAPWCCSAVQTWLKESGIGTYAGDTASVFALRDYARDHGDLRPLPLPGRLAVYQTGEGHIGVVEVIFGDGSFQTIEGNHSNACERVMRRAGEDNVVFVEVPGLDREPEKIVPLYADWRDWRLGEGKYAINKPSSLAARPKSWTPAVPKRYFELLTAQLAARKKPVVKPTPAPKPKPAPKPPVKKAWPTPIPDWFWDWATWKLNGQTARRPKSAPRLIPPWAWRRLAALKSNRKVK